MKKKQKKSTIQSYPHASGFSMIELAMIIVIASLLISGTLMIRSYIAASKIRAIMVEVNQFKTALSNFQDEYRNLPGDMPSAFSIWGNACGGNSDTSFGGCNGNGDRQVTWVDWEGVKAWQILKLAGYIVDDVSGDCSASLSCTADIPGTTGNGRNVPRSVFPDSGYFIDSAIGFGNYIGFGGARANDANRTPVLLPSQASTIDIKIDNGAASSGFVRSDQSFDASIQCFNTSDGSYLTIDEDVLAAGALKRCNLYFKIN